MKIIKIMILSSLVAVSADAQKLPIEVAINIKADSVINTVSDHFFGLNYWQWCPTWGDMIEGTAPKVSQLKVKLLRFGGIAPDVGFPDEVTNGVIDKFNGYSKEIGAEPLFQVPLACFKEKEKRISNALSMVKYYKSIDKLTYVSIGNEPDIYVGNLAVNTDYKAGYLDSYTLGNYVKILTVLQKNSKLPILN